MITKKINRFWNYLSFLGLRDLDPNESLIKFREVILVNRLIAILLLIMVIYLPIEIYMDGMALMPIMITEMTMVGLTLWFNARKYFFVAKVYFFITAVLATGPFLLITPREAGNNLMMLPVACIPIILFNKFWQMISGFLIVVILFYLIDYYRDGVEDIIKVPDATLQVIPKIFAGMLFAIFLALMYYFKHINLQYQSLIIEKTKELSESNAIIEQHNKDITDSINYAKKIQEAYMPPEGALSHYFPKSFLVFKPKDIVSGDFYWIYSPEENGIKSDEVFIAVADCTGHGVPGAIMSVICCNALNEATITKGIRDTGKILDATRESIIQNLKSKDTKERKDGMDISLIRFNKKTNEIQFSGANNPLWYIQNGELKEIKGDKQPVGMFENIQPFSSHIISTTESQISNLFLFTDGYADQFGGPKGKKFKYANLQRLLLENTNLELSTPALSWAEGLNLRLSNEFENWKGDLEQVDDVCIIGIRI